MKNFNIPITVVLTLALTGGFWGCSPAPTAQVTPTLASHTDATPPGITPTPTPEVAATQTTPTAEVIGPLPETGISREGDSALTPSHPAQVKAQAITDAIILTWLGTGDDRIIYYQIYRKTVDGGDWERVTRIESIGDNRGWYEFRDTPRERGIGYIYGVSAIDTYGNESAISESSVIILN